MAALLPPAEWRPAFHVCCSLFASASISICVALPPQPAAPCLRRQLLCCDGRRIPFKLPPSADGASKAAAQLRQAQRSAWSLLLLSGCAHVEQLAAAAVLRSCLQGEPPPAAAGGGSSQGSSGGSGIACVLVGQQQVVLEAPEAVALRLLAHVVPRVHKEVAAALALPPSAAARLPFRWWCGGSLDPLQGATFNA